MTDRYDVLAEVARERDRQERVHGQTAEVDDTRTPGHWAWLLLKRATDLLHPFDEAHVDRRRELVELAAVAVAAIEAMDRAALCPRCGHPGHDPELCTVDIGSGPGAVFTPCWCVHPANVTARLIPPPT